MLYPYKCDECGYNFTVVKPAAESDTIESCSRCNIAASRVYCSFEFYGASDWNKQEYNPALGQVVYGNSHKKRILADFKAKGKEMIEIGNEPVDKIHTHFDKRREEKRLQRYADADRMKE